MKSVRWDAMVIAAAMGLSMGVSSCSVLVNTSTTQCETTADCNALGPAFVGTSCGPRKTCVPLEGFCATNQECIDRTGSPNNICQKGEKDGVSTNHCISLLSPECSKLLADPGDTANDDVVVVGTLDLSSWSALFKGFWDGLEFARRDFALTTGGLPPLPGKKSRPIVVVSCEVSVVDQGANVAATDHLLSLGVPVLVGTIIQDFMRYQLQQGAPLGTLNMSIDNPGLTTFPDVLKGLFYTSNTPAQAAGEALIVPLWEKKLRDAGKTGDIKVAYATSGLPTDIPFTNSFYSSVRFNGKTAADNQSATPPNYIEADFGQVDTGSPGASQGVGQAVQQLITFNPDVAVCILPNCEYIVQGVEKGGVHPKWVTAGSLADNGKAQFFDKQPMGMQRLLGSKPGRPLEDADFKIFLNRFTSTFPDDAALPDGAPFMYDMFYYMAFAMAGVGPKPVLTGHDIGQVIIDRFKADGVAVTTSPDAILTAYAALSQGKNLSIHAIESYGIWNPDGFLQGWQQTFFCYDPVVTNSPRFKDSGLSYDASMPGALQGSLTCF
ncbi:MAG: hypothetical protein ABIP39_15285 [Polyangiaceae bacterium]